MTPKETVLYLRIRAKPNARKTRVIGILEDDSLKIEIAAPPTQGKANQELLRFLQKQLGGEAEIVSGQGQRFKMVRILNPETTDWKSKLLGEKQ